MWIDIARVQVISFKQSTTMLVESVNGNNLAVTDPKRRETFALCAYVKYNSFVGDWFSGNKHSICIEILSSAACFHQFMYVRSALYNFICWLARNLSIY